jgi:uncharacterized protein YfiM (DUF2279 family)
MWLVVWMKGNVPRGTIWAVGYPRGYSGVLQFVQDDGLKHAKAKARADAGVLQFVQDDGVKQAKAKANAGVLQFVQDDGVKQAKAKAIQKQKQLKGQGQKSRENKGVATTRRANLRRLRAQSDVRQQSKVRLVPQDGSGAMAG